MRATDGSGLRKRKRGFAQVPNETAFDKTLSARARGVLLVVVALPEDWELHMGWLVEEFTEGRDAITAAVRELRRRGYYRVERRRRPDGTFVSGISVSDTSLPEWIEQHQAACAAQGTDRPKWDVSLRLLPDGRVEDEPVAGPPPRGGDTPPDDTDCDDPQAEDDRLPANGLSVTGEPAAGDPVPGPPVVNTKTQTKTQTKRVTSEGVRNVSRGPAPETPPETTPSTVAAAPPPAGTGPDDPEPPLRCGVHRLAPAAGPCPPCGDLRREHNAWEGRALGRVREAERAARERAAEARRLTRLEVDACRLCDERGFVSVAAGMVACTHDPSTTTGAGRAEFAAAREAERQRLLHRQRTA